MRRCRAWPRPCRRRSGSTRQVLDRLLTKCSQHLSILAAPVALDRDYDISAGACRAVLDALRQHAPFAALDLPHAWTPWLRQVLLAADEIVVTAAPDLANLRNAKNLVDLLETATNGKPPRLVINMAQTPQASGPVGGGVLARRSISTRRW